jgi:NAD(P)-dependent dehydrogenase (short-subunit alcohol dehydrogenase family)
MLAEYGITDKVVFITGAGRGIGKGIAQVLAEAGADVAINALTPRYVEHTATEIGNATGRRVVPVIADVTKTEGVQHAFETVMQAFGPQKCRVISEKSRGIRILLEFALPFSLSAINLLPHQISMKTLLESK